MSAMYRIISQCKRVKEKDRDRERKKEIVKEHHYSGV